MGFSNTFTPQPGCSPTHESNANPTHFDFHLLVPHQIFSIFHNLRLNAAKRGWFSQLGGSSQPSSAHLMKQFRLVSRRNIRLRKPIRPFLPPCLIHFFAVLPDSSQDSHQIPGLWQTPRTELLPFHWVEIYRYACPLVHQAIVCTLFNVQH